MSVAPYPIQCKRDDKWSTVQTDELLPGDVVSVGKPRNNGQACVMVIEFFAVRSQAETNIPADILLVRGTCIVNEAMLSGESTPLLKESIALLDGDERLDVDGVHKNAVVFSGTKLLQAAGDGELYFCWN